MRTKQEFGLVKRKVNSKIVYYYWVRDEGGIRRYRSTGEKTKAKAQEYVLSRRDEGSLQELDVSGVLLKDYTKDFYIDGKCPVMANMKARGKAMAKSTANNYRKVLDKYILPALGKYPINKLSSPIINRWLIKLPDNCNVKMSMANAAKKVLSNVMQQAVRDGLVKNNPCRDVENLGNDSERHNAFTLDEVRRIIGTAEDWGVHPDIRVMCMVGATTGMRIAEVLSLRPVDVQQDRINVEHSYNTFDKLKSTKTKKDRTVPIPTKVYEEISTYFPKNPQAFIFSTDGTEPYTQSTIGKYLKARCQDFGIKDKTFHSFRAFVNTRLSEANINETIIQSVIGHSGAEMTKHYLHIEAGEFENVRNAQDEILNGIIA